MTTENAGQYASRAIQDLGQQAHDSERVAIWCYDNPPQKLQPSLMARWLRRVEEFARVHPGLVCGATKISFHTDHVEVIWSKYMHTIEELQAVAKQFKHLEWRIVRSDSGMNLDWLCDFGDVLVRLQGADVLKLEFSVRTVDFEKLKCNEPTLQPQEEA